MVLRASQAVALGIVAMSIHAHAGSVRASTSAPITCLLLLINTAVHLVRAGADAGWGWERWRDRISPAAMAFGYVDVVLRRDYIRLLTHHICHSNDLHLIYNMMTLLQTGAGLERAMGSRSFLWMAVAVGLLHPALMLALAYFGRRRPDLVPAVLCRDRVVGFSGMLFAMMAVEQWTGVAGPSSWVGIAGYGRWVDPRIAGVAHLALVQVMFPNVSLAGHVCGMAAGAAYLATGMHALGTGLAAGLDTHGGEAARGIGWLVVLGAVGYWYVFVYSHTPRFANGGTVGRTTGAARAAAADAPPTAPEVADDDDYDYDDATYTDHATTGGVDNNALAAAAAARDAAADPMASPAVLRSVRMARFEKKPAAKAPDQFANRFGPQFHGSPRSVGTVADSTNEPGRPDREIRAERFAGAIKKTVGASKGKGKCTDTPNRAPRDSSIHAASIQTTPERWPPQFAGGGAVGGSATTFTGTDYAQQVQLDKLGGVQDLGAPAAGCSVVPSKPNKPPATASSSARSRKSKRPISITEIRLGRLERFTKPAVLRLSEGSGLQSPRWNAEPCRTVDADETDPFMMGEHCGICRNLDLLPVFCKWCGAPFCASHAGAVAHACANRDRQHKNESLLQRLLMTRKLAR